MIMGWYRLHEDAKSLTVTVPGKGFVVFNSASVKPLPDDIVAKHRYIERNKLVALEEEEAREAVTEAHAKAEKGLRELSAAKAARHRARKRFALREGVERSTRSPTKARSERKKGGRGAAPAEPAAPPPDAPPAE